MTARTRIKVCGMTDMAEARGAAEAGVDALGFIFVKQSPRYIDPDLARNIIRILPPFVDAVGVFVNEDPDVVGEIAQYCGLTMVQLHGDEPPEYCQKITTRIIKTFSVGAGRQAPDLSPYAGIVSGFLFDTFHEKIAGGTGETFDWSILEGIEAPGPIILAGGLAPENVSEAIRQTSPFAVDVNSGVEIEPGRKLLERIRMFVQEVGKADRQS
ncbi:MAG: phosphoribosylanthranilate isomerase [Proteobacteria bacterium]|nr:phosphoribosylanthranilate isomerase [Pseudomonadota bacterium]MBU1710600.1 phosphoribosylanthranilate isomerase [Pseudomonadota bacterium]